MADTRTGQSRRPPLCPTMALMAMVASLSGRADYAKQPVMGQNLEKSWATG